MAALQDVAVLKIVAALKPTAMLETLVALEAVAALKAFAAPETLTMLHGHGSAIDLHNAGWRTWQWWRP